MGCTPLGCPLKFLHVLAPSRATMLFIAGDSSFAHTVTFAECVQYLLMSLGYVSPISLTWYTNGCIPSLQCRYLRRCFRGENGTKVNLPPQGCQGPGRFQVPLLVPPLRRGIPRLDRCK